MNNKFSENLKKIRKEHNLSQEQLADEIGVSRQAISKWESAVAYPEMDKIITLCDKFNLNIDDLLHRDIREVKGEEESKNKINKYIDDFLKFITNTVNLFISMNFKSKVKCLFEQAIIITLLVILSNIVSSSVVSLFASTIKILPNSISHYIIDVFDSVVNILCAFASIIIAANIFKTRYLNYYLETTKEEPEKDQKVTTKKLNTSKNDNQKIIIRDPKHSDHNLINGLFKLIVLAIKFFLLNFGLFVAFTLVCLFGSFITAFLAYKTGAFFIGLLMTISSAATICIVIILLILNFVFNRKSNKKGIIWSIIISIITFGIGCGLIFTGTLKFNVSEINENMIKTETIEHDMKENLVVYPYNENIIEYIESDNDNVKIEYSLNKYCSVEEHIINDDSTINAWASCKNPTKIAREFLKNVNQKKLIPISNTIEKVTIYTTGSNIEILKNNMNRYYEEKNKHNDEITSYENRINELERENEELRSQLQEQLEAQE